MTVKNKINFLIACLCIFVFVIWEHPSIGAKIAHTNTQSFSWIKTLVLVGAELLLAIILIFASRTFGFLKYSFFALIVLSSMIFDIFYFVSFKSIEFQDFVLLIRSWANANDAYLMYWREILFSSLRGIILLIGFLIMPPPPLAKQKRNAMLSFGGFLVLILLVCVTCVIRQGGATNKLPSPISLYGLLLAYEVDSFTNPYIYQHSLGQGVVKEDEKYKHIVLVIDESIRFDYSPFLRFENYGSWSVMDYGRSISYANNSTASNIMLRKGVKFESVVEDFYKNPLIWAYAREAGYKTYLYDAQMGGIGHNYFDAIERKMIDFNISETRIESDAQIINGLGFLSSTEKTFTIIIKKGAHFPYNECHYNRELNLGEWSQYKVQTPLRVKYLKSVLCQSDSFWKNFLKLNPKEPTLVIYTSDHGQNLEDKIGATHGNTQNPYEGEGFVPLVVLTNIKDNELMKQYQNNIGNTSHFNIFPTLIEAMGYDAKSLGYVEKSVSLFHRVQSVRGFFYGFPFGFFGREPDFKRID